MAAQVITTVVLAATSRDLTTVEDLLNELELDEAVNEALLKRWIGQASLAAERYCNRIFAVETVKDEFWPDRDPWPWSVPGGLRPLQLSRFPVVSIAVGAVLEDGEVLVENADFRIDAANGHLIRLDDNGYPTKWPALAISVQYRGGFATIPADIGDAVVRMVQGRWYGKGRDPALRSEAAEGAWSASYWFGSGPGSSTGHLTPDVEGLLDAYRIPVAVG